MYFEFLELKLEDVVQGLLLRAASELELAFLLLQLHDYVKLMLEVFQSLQIALVDGIIVGGGVRAQLLQRPELLIEPHELLLLALEFLDL